MIAIIPARGGSKGVPHKNIRLLNGKPLISYTIEAAKRSKFINGVFVTTDDEEIKEISKRFGVTEVIDRPKELASDTASAIDVYIHAINYIKDKYKLETEKFIVLLPTCPLRNSIHIDEAIKLFSEKKATSLISVKKAETPASWYYKLDQNNSLINAGFSGCSLANRQENEVFYIPNGSIYILDEKLLKNKRTYYSEHTVPYIMDAENSIDIDTELDFKIAEILIKELQNQTI